MTAPAQTLVVDCPWRFGDTLPGPGRGAAKHYGTLSVEELCAFALPPLAEDCRVFFWRVAAMQAEAIEVLHAWGFGPPKAELVWVKTTHHVALEDEGLLPARAQLHFGMGRTTRASHEVCLIATRGRPALLDRSVRSVFVARAGEHSRKPERFYRLVERLSPGPYVELFARRRRPGWECLGDEVDGPAETSCP